MARATSPSTVSRPALRSYQEGVATSSAERADLEKSRLAVGQVEHVCDFVNCFSLLDLSERILGFTRAAPDARICP
jgi:hypothetical protein